MFNILLKDLKLIFADKKALAILILMPVILTSILGFALRGSFSEAGSQWSTTIAVVTEYNQETENKKAITDLQEIFLDYGQTEIDMDFNDFDPENILFNQFLESEEVSKSITYSIMNLSDAKNALERKDIDGIVIVPKNYIYNMYINFFSPFRNNIDFRIIGHPDLSYTNRIIEGFFTGFTDTITSMITAKNVFLEKGVSLIDQDVLFDYLEKMDFSDIKDYNLKTVTNKIVKKNTVTSLMYYSAAMLAMFIFFTAGYTGKYMLHEKDYKTYERILTTKVKKRNLYISKFIITMVIVIVQSIIMILYSKILFGIEWGNNLFTVLTVISSSISVAAIGLFILALSLKFNSYKVYDAFTSFIIQILALFGGSYIPVEVLPKYFSLASNFIPNGVILNSYIKTFEGTSLDVLLPNYITLLIISIMFIIVSVLILRNEEFKNA